VGRAVSEKGAVRGGGDGSGNSGGSARRAEGESGDGTEAGMMHGGDMGDVRTSRVGGGGGQAGGSSAGDNSKGGDESGCVRSDIGEGGGRDGKDVSGRLRSEGEG
jgi:hypothetical protein